MTDETHEDAQDDAAAPIAPALPAAPDPVAVISPVVPEAAAPASDARISEAIDTGGAEYAVVDGVATKVSRPEGTRVLTGDAQAAARGTLHDTIEHNTAARDRALNPGE